MRHNTKQMRVPYTIMHGAGNRILVVDQRAGNLPPPNASKLRELGNGETGPGFDQLMWVGPATDTSSVASYRVFNADGSEIEQCGNGVRCVAKLLAGSGQQRQEFTLLGPGGPVTARICADDQVTVNMGVPKFEPGAIPFEAPDMADSYTLSVGTDDIEITALSMGNPHCVIQVEDVDHAPVNELGPRIERHPRFPKRTNVGFMTVIDRENINLRVYERGVGETLACGTGACAAVVTGRRRGLLNDAVNVRLPGGQVMVSWRGGETAAWLKGNAELIDEGMMDL